MATQPTVAPKAEPVDAKFQITSVHGLVIHPYTLTRFFPGRPLPHEKDQWTQAQLDAGVLKLV